MSKLLQVFERFLSEFGVKSARFGRSIQFAANDKLFLVIDGSDQDFVYNEQVVAAVETIFAIDFEPRQKCDWEQCPAVESKLQFVSPSTLVLKLLDTPKSIKTLEEPGSKSSTNETCDVACVFERQLASNLNLIRHDIFGTVATFGSGKRIVEGMPTEQDFDLFAVRLKTIIDRVGQRQPVCRFLDSREHVALIVARLLHRLETLSVQKNIIEFKQAITQLRELIFETGK